MDGAAAPKREWFEARTRAFKTIWDETPWHRGGEERLAPLLPSIRRYAGFINRLPANFMPMVSDQHLAVLSQGYRYAVFEAQESLGESRFICRVTDGQEVVVFSPGLEKSILRGEHCFLAVLIHLEGASLPSAITYGPILGWSGLRAADISFIGRQVGRDLLAEQGLSEVIRRNPVPFWAAWSFGDTPIMFHREEEFLSIWNEGAVDPSIEEALGKGWERECIGKRTRWIKRGDKPFHEQAVFRDSKSGRGVIIARLPSYYAKLEKAVGGSFHPDRPEPERAGMVLQLIMKELFHAPFSYESWEAPFTQREKQRAAKKTARGGGDANADALQRLNAVLPDIMAAINAGREPPWIELGARHGMDEATLDSLREMADKIRGSLGR